MKKFNDYMEITGRHDTEVLPRHNPNIGRQRERSYIVKMQSVAVQVSQLQELYPNKDVLKDVVNEVGAMMK